MKLPTMDDVRAVELSGPRVASLFAGCGGSSLGYRLAGCSVLYANENDDHAATTYRANSAETRIDTRSVFDVTADDVGVVDVLDGSPPCQSWSAAGQRGLMESDNGRAFGEYVRLVGEVRPSVFVAENVEGITVGSARGYFRGIIDDLTGHGYRIEARVLDASWLGVPQTRRRVIAIGVRNDLRIAASTLFPIPEARQATMRDVLPDVRRLVLLSPDMHHDERTWPASGPAPTITANGVSYWKWRRVVAEVRDERRPLTVPEVMALCTFPADFEIEGSTSRCWKRLGNAVPPLMAKSWAERIAAAF